VLDLQLTGDHLFG